MRWRHALAAARGTSDSQSDPSDYPRFAPISSEAFNQLSDLPNRYEVPSGTRLLEQGVTPDSVLLICSGLLRLGYLNAAGDEITLGLRTNGWYAGAAPVLMNVPSVYSVTCVGPCTISSIPAAEFQLKLLQNAKLLRHFISTLCSELTAQGSAQAQLMSSSAEDRLSCFLREREVKDKRWTVMDPLPMLKQMELAQLLAIKPETLSRIIHKRDGLLNKRRKSKGQQNSITSLGSRVQPV